MKDSELHGSKHSLNLVCTPDKILYEVSKGDIP
jgi:hypothetical protein